MWIQENVFASMGGAFEVAAKPPAQDTIVARLNLDSPIPLFPFVTVVKWALVLKCLFNSANDVGR